MSVEVHRHVESPGKARASLRLIGALLAALGLFANAAYQLLHFHSAWSDEGHASKAICVLIALASCVVAALLGEFAARVVRTRWQLALATLLVGPLAAYLLALGYHAVLDTQFEPVAKAWYSTWAAALSWRIRWLYAAAMLSAPIWLLLRFNLSREPKSSDA